MREVLADKFLNECILVIWWVELFDVRLVELVANVSPFFSHHAVDVESEAVATKVCSQVFVRFLDADRGVELDVLESGECGSCELVSIDPQ